MKAWRTICTTKAFFLARLVVALIVSFVYLLIAAAVQQLIVSIMGESTFNYIMAGVCSLFAAIPVSSYLGHILLVLVRCAHVASLAYLKQIRQEGLSAYDVGNLVFRQHITSFGLVYGVSILIDKMGELSKDKLWDLLDGVPMASQMKRFCNFGIVRAAAKGIYRTAFDAVIYYIVKYTKAGISDDFEVIGPALKGYLCSLPKMALTSIPCFILFWVLPSGLQIFVCALLISTKGLVAGILITVLIWPLFFTLKKVVCEPAVTVALLTCYDEHCREPIDEESPIYQIVIEILNAADLGLDDISDVVEQTVSDYKEVKEKMQAQAQAQTDIEEEPTKPLVEEEEDGPVDIPSMFSDNWPRFTEQEEAEATSSLRDALNGAPDFAGFSMRHSEGDPYANAESAMDRMSAMAAMCNWDMSDDEDDGESPSDGEDNEPRESLGSIFGCFSGGEASEFE